MESEPSWSTSWSQRRAAAYSDFIATSDVRDEIVGVIRDLRLRCHGYKPKGLALEVVASLRQSACLLREVGETSRNAAVLFDLSQSMLLKRLFRISHKDEPCIEIANVLARSAGLAVARDCPALCHHLFRSGTPTGDAHYRHDLSTLETASAVYRRMWDALMIEQRSFLIDGYIMGHELAHFQISKSDPFLAQLLEGAGHAFEFALDQVCYQQRPDFEELAQGHGMSRLDRASLERIRQDLITRRRHYETNKLNLIEEIACDAHGLMIAALATQVDWRGRTADPGATIQGFMRLAQTYFFLFTLADLHQAMIKRARLSVEGSVEDDKSGHMADMHLRKVALMYSMAQVLPPFLPEPFHTREMFLELLSSVSQVIRPQKQALDVLITTPVTIIIKQHLVCFEADRATTATFGESPPWDDYDMAALFGGDLMKFSFRSAVS